MRKLLSDQRAISPILIVVGIVIAILIVAGFVIAQRPSKAQKQECSLFSEPKCPSCERETFTEVFRGCNDWYSGGFKKCTDSACVSKQGGFTSSVGASVQRDMTLDSDNPLGQQKILVQYTCIKKVGDCT